MKIQVFSCFNFFCKGVNSQELTKKKKKGGGGINTKQASGNALELGKKGY